MTIVAELEELSSRDSDGSRWRGCHREIISGQATGTSVNKLTVAQSGALVLFDSAAGNIYQLPPPSVGAWFEFLVTVTRTSNSHSIDTDAATTFIGLGGIVAASSTPGQSDTFVPAATDVSIDLDVATTGEQAGGNLILTCVSSTVWAVSGRTFGVGSATDPYA